MDPAETLRMLLDALSENDQYDATEHARNLSDWLDRGGFCPRVIRKDSGTGASYTVSNKPHPKESE